MTGSIGSLEYVSIVGQIDRHTNWSDALEGADVVVHLAARAHQINDAAADPRAEFFEVNYEGTRRLAEQATGRVKRFVFLSTVGVHGSTSGDQTWKEASPIAPETWYGESKARAEECVMNVAAKGGFEAVVLRPRWSMGRMHQEIWREWFVLYAVARNGSRNGVRNV